MNKRATVILGGLFLFEYFPAIPAGRMADHSEATI